MSSSDTPELEELLFYQQLTTSYPDLYTKAQEICSVIVIPQQVPNSSLLTRDFVESHLFRPSPCYVRKHVSYNEKYEIEFDNNRTLRIFYKKEGVGEKRSKVLSQEDVRDSARQRSYSILTVEQPIVDISGLRNVQNGPGHKLLTKQSSIQSLPKFNSAIATYESAFMFLDSLRSIESAFAQAYGLLNRNAEDRDIELASEIYITGNVYTKVWPIIVQHNEEKDQHLYENILKRQKKQLAQSIDANVNRNSNASNELRKLDDLKSSYEKARCIRTALDLAMAAKTLMIVDPKNSAVSYRSSIDAMPMAADETLTAFIDLICHFISSLPTDESVYLVAHEYYIEKFRFLPLPQDVDYAFTTYRGVLEYLSNSTLWY